MAHLQHLMRKDDEGSYNPCLATVMKNIHKDKLQLQSTPMRLLPPIVENCNQKLLENFIAIAIADSSSWYPTMTIDGACNAVREMVKGTDVLDLAVAESQRQLIPLRTGVLVHKSGQQPKKKHISWTSALAYLPSMSAMYYHLFAHNLTMAEAERSMAQWIYEFNSLNLSMC